MKNKRLVYLAGALLLAISVVACRAEPGAVEATKPGVPQITKPEERAWDKLVADAQREGSVAIYSSARPGAREATTRAFKEKYGINLEWVAGRQQELIAKIKRERAAGLYLVDAMLSSPENIVSDLKPMNIFLPLRPQLILSEVADNSKWLKDQVPFFEDIAIKTTILATEYRAINKSLVKEGEITSTPDLLQPKWKGKIALGDPSISGAANDWFVNEVFVLRRGLDFMQDLAKQEPAITRDQRLMAEWLAHGKYSIMLGNSSDIVMGLIREGAPVAFVETKEPRVLTFAANLILVTKDAPNPNAAKLFLNWFLSKEGSSVYSRGIEMPSTRKDVSTEGFLPFRLPRPEDIDPLAVEGYLQKKGESYDVAARILGIK